MKRIEVIILITIVILSLTIIGCLKSQEQNQIYLQGESKPWNGSVLIQQNYPRLLSEVKLEYLGDTQLKYLKFIVKIPEHGISTRELLESDIKENMFNINFSKNFKMPFEEIKELIKRGEIEVFWVTSDAPFEQKKTVIYLGNDTGQ